MTRARRKPVGSDWLSKDQAAAYLGISVRHLSRLSIKRGHLGRLPRFAKADLDGYLEHNSSTPRRKRPADKGRGPRTAAALTGRDFAAELDEFRRGGRRK